MIKKIILVIILIVFVFLGSLFIAPSAMPDSDLYPLKRLEEKIVLFTKKAPSEKLSYEIKLLDIRLQELQHVVTKKNYYVYYQTSLRYSTTAGDITNLVLSLHDQSQKQKVIILFKNQQERILKLLLKKDNNDAWKFI